MMKAALILFGILVSACSRTTENEKALIGEWAWKNGVQECEISFRADSTFDGRCGEQGKENWIFSGAWVVREDLLSYEYRRSSLAAIPVGTKDADRLIALTKTYYVAEGRDGLRRRYRRIHH